MAESIGCYYIVYLFKNLKMCFITKKRIMYILGLIQYYKILNFSKIWNGMIEGYYVKVFSSYLYIWTGFVWFSLNSAFTTLVLCFEFSSDLGSFLKRLKKAIF